jgi:hypothetical protein
MALRLTVKLQRADGVLELSDGWRGLVAFGEVWTAEDAALWPAGSGDIPVGEPLVYGCELRHRSAEGDAVLSLWSLDATRPVMTKGTKVRLLDGSHLRAGGEFVRAEI